MKRLALSSLVFAATIASTRPAFADPVSSFYSFAYIGEGTTGDYPDQTPVYIDITGELVIDPTPVAPVPESLHSEVTSTTPAAYEVVFGNFTFDGNLSACSQTPFPAMTACSLMCLEKQPAVDCAMATFFTRSWATATILATT